MALAVEELVVSCYGLLLRFKMQAPTLGPCPLVLLLVSNGCSRGPLVGPMGWNVETSCMVYISAFPNHDFWVCVYYPGTWTPGIGFETAESDQYQHMIFFRAWALNEPPPS